LADVRPFEAIRYAPATDLSRALCPPFDTISPEEQRRLYDLSPVNAVRLELPAADGDPYQSAARTLQAWLSDGVLVRDEGPAFYVFQQEFRHGGGTYRRTVLFARLRLEPWERGVVLPHERTFRAPKEDRLKLLRALRLNTSPVFLMYADPRQEIAPLLTRALSERPAAEFDGAQGLSDRWGVFVSHGDFYASTIVAQLGHADDGLVRAGCACYTSDDEVDREQADLVEFARRLRTTAVRT